MDLSGSRQDDRCGIWNPIFIKVFIVNLLLHMGLMMMNTLSATYADFLGATATVVGVVSSLFALTAMIFKLFAAPAIDSFNRKSVLTGAILVLFISFVGYSVSTTIPMLVISRLLTGVGIAFTSTACITIASDSLPLNRMSYGIGTFSLSTAICQAVAPMIGLKLVEKVGYNLTFSIFAVVLLLAMAVAATMQISSTSGKKFVISLRGIFAQEVLAPGTILFLLNVTFSAVAAFLVLFAGERGITSNIGYFFTVFAFTMVFTRPLIGRLADQYGIVKVFLISMICFAISFLVISGAKTLPVFLLAGFISAFGYGGCQPALMAVCMKSVSKERRGAASSTCYLALDLGNLIGPVLAGLIVEGLGYVRMWQVMMIPIAFAVLVSIIYREQITNAGENFTAVAAAPAK